METYTRRDLLGFVPKLGIGLALGSALAVTPKPAEADTVFRGYRFDKVRENGEWHHFVEFYAPMCANRWWVSGPIWCWLWPPDKPLCGAQPWGGGPNPDGYARAGIRFPGNRDVPWWIRPSWFELHAG